MEHISANVVAAALGNMFGTPAFEAGVVFGHPQGTLDPTTDGPLADANVLMHGSIKRLLTTIVMFSAGYAVLRTRIFSSWVVWSAYFVGLCNPCVHTFTVLRDGRD
jgi:hypothetical protein